MSPNSTQIVGLLAFSGTALACMHAARHGGPAWRQVGWCLTLIHAVLALEVALGLRHSLQRTVAESLRLHQAYADRAEIQIALLVLLAAMGSLALVLAMHRLQRAGTAAKLASAGTLASVALVAAETVSLHALDTWFYAPVGPLLRVGWLWLVAAMWTAVCAYLALRQYQRTAAGAETAP